MQENEKTSGKRIAGAAAALCSVIGTVILIAVILLMMSLFLPRLVGYNVYNVVSGSMEPAIPVGSIVYVRPDDPDDIEIGEVIAFQGGDGVVTHRVVEKRTGDRTLVTKGDANKDNDLRPVEYDRVIGSVALNIPVIGSFMSRLTTLSGKLYLLCLIICGALLNVVASRLKAVAKGQGQNK